MSLPQETSYHVYVFTTKEKEKEKEKQVQYIDKYTHVHTIHVRCRFGGCFFHICAVQILLR